MSDKTAIASRRSKIATSRKRRPSREEKAQLTYVGLMNAAATVVAREGYAQASIAKITTEAGIAHGTFYNYFEDRQSLFDELLPHVGRQMVEAIVKYVPDEAVGADREIERFRAYCRYLAENPGFYRILYEAEVFAPSAHAAHVARMADGYRRALRRSVERGEIQGYDDDELDVIIHAMLGARAYISMIYFSGESSPETVPDAAVTAYAKFVRNGLFD